MVSLSGTVLLAALCRRGKRLCSGCGGDPPCSFQIPSTRHPSTRDSFRPAAGQSARSNEVRKEISMRKHAAARLVFFAFAGAAILGSCAKPYHEENERYVFVSTNINLPYWKQQEAGFEDAAKALG